jgi:hypothetical protein
MTRFVDRGAILAGWVGVGMAMTIAVSFLLVVPIEPVFWLMAPFAGLVIGYYANSRAGRTGPWSRILANGLYAGLVTAATLAILFVATKAIFFYGDNGYPLSKPGGPLAGCASGPPCVFARYVNEGEAAAFERAGIRTVDDFTAFYWREQLGTAATVFALCTAGALGGALAYGLVRPKPGPTAALPGPSATDPPA